MEKWIDNMNEMFSNHCWTDNNRVAITYIKENDAIVVRVLSNMRILRVDDYSEYGLMMKIMETVNELYYDKKEN